LTRFVQHFAGKRQLWKHQNIQNTERWDSNSKFTMHILRSEIMNLKNHLFLILLANLFTPSLSITSTVLTDFSARNVSCDNDIQLIEEGHEDFELDPSMLNEGDVQFFAGIDKREGWRNKAHSSLLRALVQKMEPGKHHDISYLKIAYIINDATSSSFAPPIVCSKKFINKTILNAKFISSNLVETSQGNQDEGIFILPQIGCQLKTKKKLLPKVYAETEFSIFDVISQDTKNQDEHHRSYSSLNTDLGTAHRLTYSVFESCSYGMLKNSRVITQYFDLPDKSGTLVVQYTIGIVSFGRGMSGAG